MLKAMRDGAQSVIIKWTLFGLLILAMLGLALISDTGLTRGGLSNSPVAKIGREKISQTEFDYILQNALRQQNIPAEEAYRTGLPFSVLEQEISSRIFARAAYDMGILVDDVTVAKSIKEQIAPMAQEAKTTEADIFQRILRNMGLSEAAFVASVKSQIATDTVLKAITVGVRAPEQLVKDAMNYRYEWRKGDYFVINTEDAGKIGTPSEDDLRRHYESIAEQFSLPEYRSFAVLLLDAATLGLSTAVTEEEIRAYYDENIAEFSSLEKRTIDQLVVTDEALAQEIFAKVSKTKKLKDAADAASKGKVSYIRDTYAEEDIAVELAPTAFATAKGSVAAPIKSPFGWHILYVDSIIPAAVTPYEKAKSLIQKDLAAEKSAGLLYERANEIDDMLAGGKALAEVAAEFSIKETNFEDVSSEGVDMKGKKIETALPLFNKILENAFTLDEGSASQLIETPEGGFMVVETRSIRPSEQQAFETVRPEVEESWRQKERGRLLDDYSARILEKIQLGESFEKVAASLGKRVESTGMIRRGTTPPKAALERGLMPALFSMNRIGEVANIPAANSVTILKLSDRKIDPPGKLPQEEVENMRLLLQRSLQNDIVEQYRNSLMKEYKVSINEDLMLRNYSAVSEAE